jgi:hypothetical protein
VGATIRSLPKLAEHLKGQNRGPHARAA